MARNGVSKVCQVTVSGPWCWRCHTFFETQNHILGSCESVKGSRIKRDNFICKGLKYVAEKPGWTGYEEPVIRDPTGKTKKPDIILVSKGEASL